MLKFSAWDGPAKNVIQLFPHKPSSIDGDIINSQKDSPCKIADGTSELGVVVE